MVFDASKPIVRKGQRPTTSSLETAMAEEAREVEALIAARNARIATSSQGTRPKDLESAFDFRVSGRQSSSINPMFASRKTGSNAGQLTSTQSGLSTMNSRDSRAGSRSANNLTIPGVDPRRASSPGPQPLHKTRSGSSSSNGDLTWKGAHRKLSEAALANSKGSLAALPMSATQKEAIEKERLTKDHDPEAAIDTDSSDENDDNSSSDDENAKARSYNTTFNARAPMSLAQAAENERIDIERSDTKEKLKRESNRSADLNILIGDNSPSAARRKPIHPNTSYTDNALDVSGFDEEEDDPFEEISRDLSIIRSTSSEVGGRLISTLQRADFPTIHSAAKRTRQYLVSVDLSPQAKYALEWTIGTVMRDGDICRIVHAIDYDEKEDKRSNLQLAEERNASMEDIFVDLVLFLKRTRLSVRIEVEVIHHATPKHLITEIIDTTNPTMVIIGSRGRSNISGIMLGSFSNYIVNKSSVPVMVARKRLRRGSKKRAIVPPPTKAQQFPNNTFSSVRKID